MSNEALARITVGRLVVRRYRRIAASTCSGEIGMTFATRSSTARNESGRGASTDTV